MSFESFGLKKQLNYAIQDLDFKEPTPIQEASFNVVRSGKDMIGIAQTGTGKTLAYALPILQDLSFSKQVNPRVLILVPTRELVIQVVEQFDAYAKYMNLRIMGVYGGANINTQRDKLAPGLDILVATPRRLYDIVLSAGVKLKSIKKLVIDEVDVMLDLGFRHQLVSLLELMPEKRQNIMFSATMTEEVEEVIHDFFIKPEKVSIAISGTPLENIDQLAFPAKNFHTKKNLIAHLLSDKKIFKKVIIFMPSKRSADLLHRLIEEDFGDELGVIHSNKSQNYRERMVTQFDNGTNRILIATDVIARGLDLEKVSHIINFDVPKYPENYMHRIGRTGRAKEKGTSITIYNEEEIEFLEAIESLMGMQIQREEFPEEVEVSNELTYDEQPKNEGTTLQAKNIKKSGSGLPKGFHEKKAKNKKTNQGPSYKKKLELKYKKKKRRK